MFYPRHIDECGDLACPLIVRKTAEGGAAGNHRMSTFASAAINIHSIDRTSTKNNPLDLTTLIYVVAVPLTI